VRLGPARVQRRHVLERLGRLLEAPEIIQREAEVSQRLREGRAQTNRSFEIGHRVLVAPELGVREAEEIMRVRAARRAAQCALQRAPRALRIASARELETCQQAPFEVAPRPRSRLHHLDPTPGTGPVDCRGSTMVVNPAGKPAPPRAGQLES
jgi:hypothetical protein